MLGPRDKPEDDGEGDDGRRMTRKSMTGKRVVELTSNLPTGDLLG
jgi:hypothetical protein